MKVLHGSVKVSPCETMEANPAMFPALLSGQQRRREVDRARKRGEAASDDKIFFPPDPVAMAALLTDFTPTAPVADFLIQSRVPRHALRYRRAL